MMGIMLTIFADKSLTSNYEIPSVKFGKKKQGFAGWAPNKGSVMCKVTIGDTSIIFANCHLESGKKNMQKRVQQIQNIFGGMIRKFGYV